MSAGGVEVLSHFEDSDTLLSLMPDEEESVSVTAGHGQPTFDASVMSCLRDETGDDARDTRRVARLPTKTPRRSVSMRIRNEIPYLAFIS